MEAIVPHLPDLSFGDRSSLIADSLRQFLPDAYETAVSILIAALRPEPTTEAFDGYNGFEIMPQVISRLQRSNYRLLKNRTYGECCEHRIKRKPHPRSRCQRYRGPIFATAHWGCDGGDMWQDGPAGLGQLRSFTVPEAHLEHLPHHDPVSGIVFTAAGRVDNRDELIGQLRTENTIPDGDLLFAAYLFGVRKREGEFEAHAWIEQGAQVLNDRADVRDHYAAFTADMAMKGMDWK